MRLPWVLQRSCTFNNPFRLMSSTQLSFQRALGYTLVELAIVVALIGILATYAVVRTSAPGDATLPSQAHRLAADIRQAQLLAQARGSKLCINTGTVGSAEGYWISPDCDIKTAITNPMTGAPYQVALAHGVSISSTPAASLYIDSMGRPVDSNTVLLAPISGTDTAKKFVLSTSLNSVNVTVSVLTGKVSTP